MIRSKSITQYDIINRIGKVNDYSLRLRDTLELYSRKYDNNNPDIKRLSEITQELREIAEKIFSDIKLETGINN